MNSGNDTWYNELYRIFSDGQLLSVSQTVKVGQCMRAIKAGENAQYHLNDLLLSLGKNQELYDKLNDYITAYIRSYNREDDNNEIRGKTGSEGERWKNP